MCCGVCEERKRSVVGFGGIVNFLAFWKVCLVTDGGGFIWGVKGFRCEIRLLIYRLIILYVSIVEFHSLARLYLYGIHHLSLNTWLVMSRLILCVDSI